MGLENPAPGPQGGPDPSRHSQGRKPGGVGAMGLDQQATEPPRLSWGLPLLPAPDPLQRHCCTVRERKMLYSIYPA